MIFPELEVPGILEKASEDGLVEKKSTTMHQFSYSQVQESLYALVLKDDRHNAIHRRLGKLLWQLYDGSTGNNGNTNNSCSD